MAEQDGIGQYPATCSPWDPCATRRGLPAAPPAACLRAGTTTRSMTASTSDWMLSWKADMCPKYPPPGPILAGPGFLCPCDFGPACSPGARCGIAFSSVIHT